MIWAISSVDAKFEVWAVMSSMEIKQVRKQASGMSAYVGVKGLK